jgi:hypothetical protein
LTDGVAASAAASAISRPYIFLVSCAVADVCLELRRTRSN